MKRIVLAAGLLCSVSLYAGYDETNWGDSLKSIEKKFPKGKLKHNFKNKKYSTYSFKKDVASYPARLDFSFDEKNKLNSVSVVFTQSELPRLSDRHCDTVYKDLKEKLMLKYVTSPFRVSDNLETWFLENGENITLGKSLKKEDCFIMINYSNKKNKSLELNSEVDTGGL